MASRNNTANRGLTLVILCPECQSKLQIVVKAGKGQKGRFLGCTKCEYSSKYQKGDYSKYEHKWVKGG